MLRDYVKRIDGAVDKVEYEAESGKIENPSIGLIAKVCTAMQITINEVMI